MSLDLALVMPVFNEEECIARVILSHREVLLPLGIRFRLIVLNDGSTDGTGARLELFRSDPLVEVIDQANTGHGPAILRGYRRAVELADWVFQCDSDDEISPLYLPMFWQRRLQFDAVLGIRQHGKRSFARKIISKTARLTVRLVFGRGIHDVNVPYRLIRASVLKELIAQIPPGTFAPNVIISGSLAREGLRILEIPITCEGRRTGSPSIVKLRLWKSAAVAFWQTLVCRPHLWSCSK